MVGYWLAFTPLFEGLGVFKRTWSLFEQRQVVQGIENILLSAIATRVIGKPVPPLPDLDRTRIGFERHFTACTLDGYGATIGVVGRLAVEAQPYSGPLT